MALAPLEEFSDLEVFALFVLYEAARGTVVDTSPSHWAPYLNLMPRDTGIPLSWSSEAVDALQASPVYRFGDSVNLTMSL